MNSPGNNFFTLDDTQSKAMGIIISGESTYGAPIRDIETISIPGRNGDIVIDHGRYNSVTIAYRCMTKTLDAADDARDWLMSHSDKQYKLTDTYHPSEYRMARVSEALDPTVNLRTGMTEFDVHFECDPRRFLTSGSTVTTVAAKSSARISNPTRHDAQPLIFLSSPGTVRVGNRSITVATESQIFVDCDAMYAYKLTSSGTRITKNSALTVASGRWPILSGDMGTTITNSTSGAVYITPRFWRL